MHCQDDLRCFEHSCRRLTRSTVGDYNAALGSALEKRGDLEGAVAAYSAAVVRYDADKLAVPPDVDCAYGAVLASARSNPKHAELAAKVLHRCILAVPAGGALRFAALDQLVTLAENGLDPQLLGGSKLADTYLTKNAVAPAMDKLTITVTPTPAPTGKHWPKVPAMLTGELKPALIACWQKFAATNKGELTVTFNLKVAYIGSADYDDEGGWITKVDPNPPASDGEACVRAAVEPAIKGLRLGETLNSRVTITIK